MVGGLGLVHVHQSHAQNQNNANDGDGDADGDPGASGQSGLSISGRNAGDSRVTGCGSGEVGCCRVLSVNEWLISFLTNQGGGLSLLSNFSGIWIFGICGKLASILSDQHGPPVFIIHGVLTVELRLVLSWSVDADSKSGVAASWWRLGQFAFPWVDYSLVEVCSAVKTEPGLLLVPPDRSDFALVVLACLASSLTRSRRSRSRRRWWRGGRRTSITSVDLTGRASASESAFSVGTHRARLGASVGVLFTLVDVSAVESVTTEALSALTFVARAGVGTSGVSAALLPGESKGVLRVSTLVDVGTAKSIADESVVTDALEASFGVDTLGVG